ncbi:hypothetical protein HNQ93_004050 [Hymenobacter luteus]|uniref:Uncharacterized protein n=2 Tax=Hymenobacter TaxID=89966 RepID=A0A7W9T3Y6_9BACT|nr:MULTISPECIES: hypothetical protein [Hymenobacter]MBB4603475.1 hypothetical protein [Hymenobacter latericoloratus]MBB6061171.1 hypothetical protein [Hymenobacter luteus]
MSVTAPVTIQFNDERADFRGQAYQARLEQMEREAAALRKHAVVDRERMKMRAKR